MILSQWFLYNWMWYTLLFLHLKYHILVLKVLKSNFYLSIYFFSTLNLSLMSSGIIVEKKMKNLDFFLKWGALSYLSFCTWLWLNFLHMTFGIYILILFVNRKSSCTIPSAKYSSDCFRKYFVQVIWSLSW